MERVKLAELRLKLAAELAALGNEPKQLPKAQVDNILRMAAAVKVLENGIKNAWLHFKLRYMQGLREWKYTYEVREVGLVFGQLGANESIIFVGGITRSRYAGEVEERLHLYDSDELPAFAKVIHAKSELCDLELWELEVQPKQENPFVETMAEWKKLLGDIEGLKLKVGIKRDKTTELEGVMVGDRAMILTKCNVKGHVATVRKVIYGRCLCEFANGKKDWFYDSELKVVGKEEVEV